MYFSTGSKRKRELWRSIWSAWYHYEETEETEKTEETEETEKTEETEETENLRRKWTNWRNSKNWRNWRNWKNWRNWRIWEETEETENTQETKRLQKLKNLKSTYWRNQSCEFCFALHGNLLVDLVVHSSPIAWTRFVFMWPFSYAASGWAWAQTIESRHKLRRVSSYPCAFVPQLTTLRAFPQQTSVSVNIGDRLAQRAITFMCMDNQRARCSEFCSGCDLGPAP